MAKAEILDETGSPLKPESIFTVRNYDEDFNANEETAKILVNEKLRKEWQSLQSVINKATEALLKGIAQQAKSKRDFEHEISSLLTNDNDFETALTRIHKEIPNKKVLR